MAHFNQSKLISIVLLGCLRQVEETNASRKQYSLLKQSGILSRDIAELKWLVCLAKQEEQEQLVNHHYSVARMLQQSFSSCYRG